MQLADWNWSSDLFWGRWACERITTTIDKNTFWSEKAPWAMNQWAKSTNIIIAIENKITQIIVSRFSYLGWSKNIFEKLVNNVWNIISLAFCCFSGWSSRGFGLIIWGWSMVCTTSLQLCMNSFTPLNHWLSNLQENISFNW